MESLVMQSKKVGDAIGAAQTLGLARLFADVPDSFRQMVLGGSAPLAIKKGMSLFERGDAGGHMYVVQEGRIEISIVTEMGKKIVLNQIGPGHCVGEISMIDRGVRTASAIALENSKVFSVSRAAFLDVMKECPQLAINIMEVLCDRLRWVSDSVEEYAAYPFELRLARRLLVLNQSFGDAGKTVGITQDFAGATRESVNKTLMQWKQDGLVDVQRGKILLMDIKVLERIGFGETND
jgi:CRP/FNR family transcriptional regulator, cyclic AMP receptor protein